jgi:hypothetical protein
MSVLKRQREARKAEKAAMKRERRDRRSEESPDGAQVATRDEMESYGFRSNLEDAD